MMDHRKVFTAFLKEAPRDGGKIIVEWLDWRNDWMDENGYQLAVDRDWEKP